VRLSVKKGVGCPILLTFTEDGALRELRGMKGASFQGYGSENALSG